MRKQRILIVEDEEPLARYLKRHLESQGFEVHTETHGAKALVFAAEYRPDLAILDLRLPDMSGYDVCRELRRLNRPWKIPILMLTALAEPIDKARGFSSGSDAYLTKPCDYEEVSRAVAALLEDKRAA
jgi:DNA-binding response OmpR family regulator